MMRTAVTACLILLCFACLTGCQEETPSTKDPEPAEATQTEQPQAEPTPPVPPLFEDFQGKPTLSLFPRVGDYRPEDEDERLPYWNTFIEHLTKVSGTAQNKDDGNVLWTFRSINTIDSLGYFSPIQVTPETSYQISFKLKADLPEESSAGIGVLEFNEFLWVGEQYTESLFKEHYRGFYEGKRLTGSLDLSQHEFTVTTGPDTRMIHLVLYREGPHDRNAVMFDDIQIVKIENAE